jgi:hypothetical protein
MGADAEIACTTERTSRRARRDDRLAVPAPRAGAVIRRVQRAGLQDRAPGGLDQRPTGGGRAALADAAAARRRLAGLADLRVQAEVGDEFAAGQKPARVADGGDERRGADQVDPGDGHQPADLRPLERLLGDQPLDRDDLRIEELDLADPGVDGLALFHGKRKGPRATRGP